MKQLVMGALMAACGDTVPSQTTVQVERLTALELQVVDHDSDYMRRVHAHVGSERTGALDPAARGAGVSAHEDVWQIGDTAHRVGHDFYLEATNRGTVTGRTQLEGYFAQLTNNPSFIVPLGHELAFEQSEPGRWRSYYLHEPIVLDGNAVINAEVDDRGERLVVLADLSDAAARTFGQVTSQIVGGKLAILSDGVVVSAPIINDQIWGGTFAITMGSDNGDENLDAAKALAAKLDRD